MAELPHMPGHDEILARATELFMQECARQGLPALTPEESELKEGGYWDRARSELMSGVKSQLEQYLAYLEGEADKIRGELGIEKVIPEERMAQLENQLSSLTERYKTSKAHLEETRAEIQRIKEKPPTPAAPAPAGLTEEQKKRLEDAFKRVFEEAGVKSIPLATFRDELDRLQEDLRSVERTRAYDLAYKDIVDVAMGILPKRAPELIPAPPAPRAPREVAVPPSEMLGPRRRDVITLKCWVPDCTDQCMVDKDLMRRVSMIPVMKAWSPRGVRYEPLLALPPLFFYSCESHRYEKFGYRSTYDALAYLLFESRSSGKRMTITKGTFVDVGLGADDIAAIQVEEAKWLAERGSPASS